MTDFLAVFCYFTKAACFVQGVRNHVLVEFMLRLFKALVKHNKHNSICQLHNDLNLQSKKLYITMKIMRHNQSFKNFIILVSTVAESPPLSLSLVL